MNQEAGLLAIDTINKLWPIFIFILVIVWKQINTHFDVKEMKINYSTLKDKTQQLENEFDSALKNHIIENKNSIKELTNAINELVKITSIIATRIDYAEREKIKSDFHEHIQK